MNSYLKRYSFDYSKSFGNFSGHWADKEIKQKEVYGKLSLLNLKGGLFLGIENYDAYLTKMYGDYMKLPPEEQRLCHFN
jgi:lipopolysaccharide cholinephosphotransferase